MSTADTETRSVWCCLCCARPQASDDSLEESQRLLRDGQQQPVRREPGKSYGSSDTYVEPTPTDSPEEKPPYLMHNSPEERPPSVIENSPVDRPPSVQENSPETRDDRTTVDVVPKTADPEPESSESSSNKPQHRPDVVPTEETEPKKREDTDVSAGAGHTESPDLSTEAAPQEKPPPAERTDDKGTSPASPAEHGDASQGADRVLPEPETKAASTEMPADTFKDTSLLDKTASPKEAPAATTEADDSDESISILQPEPETKSIESEKSQGDSLTSFSILADQGDAKDKTVPETDPVDITAAEEKVQAPIILEEAAISERGHDGAEPEGTLSPASTAAAVPAAEEKRAETAEDTVAAGEYKAPESHEKVEDVVAPVTDKTEDDPKTEASTEDKETDSVKPGDPIATSGESAEDREATPTTSNKPAESMDEHGS